MFFFYLFCPCILIFHFSFASSMSWLSFSLFVLKTLREKKRRITVEKVGGAHSFTAPSKNSNCVDGNRQNRISNSVQWWKCNWHSDWQVAVRGTRERNQRTKKDTKIRNYSKFKKKTREIWTITQYTLYIFHSTIYSIRLVSFTNISSISRLIFYANDIRDLSGGFCLRNGRTKLLNSRAGKQRWIPACVSCNVAHYMQTRYNSYLRYNWGIFTGNVHSSLNDLKYVGKNFRSCLIMAPCCNFIFGIKA